MYPWLFVGLGGFIGAILRYLISGWIRTGSFPGGTLTVNLIGSFAISFILFGTEERGYFSSDIRIFLAIGVLGSFTTMSSFNYETFRLLQNDQFLLALLNMAGNLILGLMAVYLGRVVVLSLR